MKKINKKGFTLVELLASLVILGLLTAIAAPNIIGIVESSRNNTYIEDAKKLATLAEYRLRSDSNISRPSTDNKCIAMSMKYLGTSEFKNSPNQSNKGAYSEDMSFVLIKKVGSKYEYLVQLIEVIPDKKNPSRTSLRGIKTIPVKNIASKYITNPTSSQTTTLSAGTRSARGAINTYECNNSIEKVYLG